MSALTVELHENLHQKAREVAAAKNMSMDALVAIALAQSLSRLVADPHLENRAAQSTGKGLAQLRDEGWFTNYWARLGNVAAIRKDNKVLSQASALLAGLDARARTVLKGVEAGSAAFAPDGRVLVGGTRGGPAMLIGTNGVASNLPVRGEGPVGWSAGGSPLQLIAVTNGLVLRNATTGKVTREFPLDGVYPSRPDSVPTDLPWRRRDGTSRGSGMSPADSLFCSCL